MKFQYQIVKVEPREWGNSTTEELSDALVAKMNEAGEQRWRLVPENRVAKTEFHVLMEREVPEPSDPPATPEEILRETAGRT